LRFIDCEALKHLLICNFYALYGESVRIDGWRYSQRPFLLFQAVQISFFEKILRLLVIWEK
jgi:hypothetical protein